MLSGDGAAHDRKQKPGACAPRDAEAAAVREAIMTCHTSFPDLAPWLDSVSDDYDELPSEGHEVPYDE